MRKIIAIVIRSLKIILLILCVALFAFTGWIIWHFGYGLGLPDTQQIAAADRFCSTSRNGVPLAEIPPVVRSAFIAVEEPDFYDRPPIIREFALAFIQSRRPRSAPMATHVARCLMPSDCCKGLDRVIGELVLMNRVDATLSKDRLFEIYLNDAYFGRGANGVTAAATAYFGKPLGELSPDEIAFVVMRARYPARSTGGEREISLRNYAIDRMQQAGVISEREAITARERPLNVLERPG
jgi:penicillin-binding protein 1A